MLKPSEIVIRITQDVPTINKITFRARCQPGENAECICTKTELGEPACWRSNGEYVCTYVVRHNDITSFVTKINLENIFYVGLESSRKHNNYVFGKNKDWGGSLELLFIFLLFIALLRCGGSYRNTQARSEVQSEPTNKWRLYHTQLP